MNANTGESTTKLSVEVSNLLTSSTPQAYTSRIISLEPKIILIDDFLTPEECSHLQQAARDKLEKSTVVDNTTGQSVPYDHRSSFGMYFYRNHDEVVCNIEQRIMGLVNVPLLNLEPFQLLRYGPGQEYRAHYDYFDPDIQGSQIHLQRGGQRFATLIMYLNEVEQGGDTGFPNVGIRVIPKVGRAVLFYNVQLNGQPDPMTLHSGDPVVAGEKWITTCWLRQGAFE
jgi:prolyl 4-hydroxylase